MSEIKFVKGRSFRSIIWGQTKREIIINKRKKIREEEVKCQNKEWERG